VEGTILPMDKPIAELARVWRDRVAKNFMNLDQEDTRGCQMVLIVLVVVVVVVVVVIVR